MKWQDIELQQRQPGRLYIHKPNDWNLPIPLNIKTEHAKSRIIDLDNKWIERFNRSHKLQILMLRD